MVDIHSHIVFGVDDGAKSIDQSIKLIREAEKAGFDTVIATPHYIKGGYDCKKNEIAEKISAIKQKLHEIDCNVQILQGNEIYFDKDINKFLEAEEAVALNDGRYVLFELPLNSEVLGLMQVVNDIKKQGRIPVLAHPERYGFAKKDPNVLILLIQSGVLMQSNYGSILGRYGKDAQKTIIKMLKHNMVHFLASDVHFPKSIYLEIDNAKERIVSIIGEEKFKTISTDNQIKLINNEDIHIDAPITIKKFSLFKRNK